MEESQMEESQSSAPRRVEAYLDAVLTTLPRRLSALEHDNLRRELREHLWSRVEAYKELGQTEDDAVTETLQQFGGGQDFLRQWRREWAKTPRRMTLQEIYFAGRQALIPSLTGITGANVFYLVVQECIWHWPKLNAFLGTSSYNDAIGWSMGGASFLLLPLFVGVRHGRRTPKYAGVGMVTALAAEVAVASVIYGAVTLGSANGSSSGTVNMLFNFLIAMTAVWIPVAGGAAALTSLWTRRTRARRVA